ncbi:MAG: aminotransferase class V-fold PLP-dependent enzyme [Pseudomonadota bacterium]
MSPLTGKFQSPATKPHEPNLADTANAAAPCRDLLDRVRDDLRSQRSAFQTPFGTRPLIYADYTASGRALSFIEDNIRSQVLPSYANTHSEASYTGSRTNGLREAARAAVRRSVNGTQQDKVLFCGAGATGAINRLIDILGLRLPALLDERYALLERIPEAQRPVVFVGPYEHHSNELPWRESIADVVRIRLDEDGQIDQTALRAGLEAHRDRPMLIGSFSAASNVTGVKSDVAAITAILKSAGALAFWDYAAAGPYVAIDVNRDGAAMDAVFISPHKFVGGPGTPGVLVVKEALLSNRVPAVVGGGTVSYVSPDSHRYVENLERREEGGTPAIVEAIRAGAVFALKDGMGAERIEAVEHQLVRRALAHFAQISEVEVLGPHSERRLGIFSLRFRYGHRDLHHGFVTALLNDLFGIQARGGCSCAGPYGHDLLGMDRSTSESLDALVERGYDCLKPGWVRINLHFAAGEEEIDYLLQALALVAEHGWRLLPSYALEPSRGIWRHRDAATREPVRITELLRAQTQSPSPRSAAVPDLDATMNTAREILVAGAPLQHCEAALAEPGLPEAVDELRWFASSAAAARQLVGA